MKTQSGLCSNNNPTILPDGQEIKTHGTANFPYAVYRCIIPDYMPSYPLHYHEELELICCTSGSGTISINGIDQTVETGDLAVILPLQMHAISSVCEPFEYFNILFKFSLLEPELENSSPYLEYFLPFFKGDRSISPIQKKDSTLYSLLSPHIFPLIDAQKKMSILMIKSHLYAIMDLLYQNSVPSEHKSASDQRAHNFLRYTLQYISIHYAEKIEISEISALCGYSKSHFMKLFHELTGTSFSQYLIHFRLEKAASLLHSTDKSVLEIAASCGFSNASYFTRAFERQYHCTPSAFRH